MRRAERLFQLVQLVRGRRLSTARYLAEQLEVSERTVYRDVADLAARGVPIEGEAGVGYRMGAHFDLPPLMFSHAEAQALVAAVRIARPRLDDALAADGDHALSKILGVLPPAVRAAADSLALYAVPPAGPDAGTRRHLTLLRRAIEARRKLHLYYRDTDGRDSERTVRPLGCVFWSEVWTLAAWCELRGAFRSFRVDRIRAVEVLDEGFRDEADKSLAALFRSLQAEGHYRHQDHA